MSEHRTVEVKYDPDARSIAPRSEGERIAWETFDTALNILREGAVRITIEALRMMAQREGLPFPETDEEFLTDEEGVKFDYSHLAPDGQEAASFLETTFHALCEEAMADAMMGAEIGVRFDEEVRKLIGDA